MAKRTIEAALLLILSIAVVSHGQIAAVADAWTGAVSLIDPENGVVASVAGVAGIRRIAANGRGGFWATVPSAQAVLFVDAALGTSSIFPTNGTPLAVAMDPADRPWFTLRTGSIGSLISLDDFGNVAASIPCLPSPDLLHIDAAGDFWITHGSGSAPGGLSHYAPSGQLVGYHVLGGGCRSVQRAPSGDLFALCQFPERLYRYTAAGDLLAIIPLGPAVRDFSVADDGLIYVAYGGAGSIEMRDADGAVLYSVPCPEQPQTIFLDEYGRIFHAGASGFVTRRGRYLAYEASWPVTSGLVLCGDAGIGFARHAGRSIDFDDDEYVNADELSAGSHRFDRSDTPAEFSAAFPVTPGSVTPFFVRRRGFPGALIWIGAAEAPLARGTGTFGFSLPAGAAFDLAQDPALGLFMPLLAWLDVDGRCTVHLMIPPEPALSGIEFYAAFIAFPSFPALGDADSSPAFPIVIQ